MAYRNKTYVCFDADTDMDYYCIMQAWHQNEYHEFEFHNAHDLNNLRDGSSEETIKRKLRERLYGSKLMVVLVGESTKNLYKFVRWEIEQAIDLGIPIIVVNLNGRRSMDSERCPAILRQALAVHVSFKQKIIAHAMENWPEDFGQKRRAGNSGPFVYNEAMYQRLGIPMSAWA